MVRSTKPLLRQLEAIWDVVDNGGAGGGAQGPAGPQGPKGDKGDTGDTGPEGPRGPQGNAGPQGLQGETGPQGLAGNDGAAGAQGPAGNDGAQGPAGNTGPQGPAGADSTVPGPQGETGPQGIQGVQGEAGPQGPAGNDGAAGTEGPQGIQGIQGETGAQGPAGGGGQTVLNFHADGGANCTLTNQANAEQYLANSARNEVQFDGTNFTQVRLCAYVVTASASVNSPRLYPQYWSGSAWTTIGAGTTASGEASALTPTGIKVTSWINLPAGAKADVRFRVAMHGGDGAADPALGNVSLQFK